MRRCIFPSERLHGRGSIYGKCSAPFPVIRTGAAAFDSFYRWRARRAAAARIRMITSAAMKSPARKICARGVSMNPKNAEKSTFFARWMQKPSAYKSGFSAMLWESFIPARRYSSFRLKMQPAADARFSGALRRKNYPARSVRNTKKCLPSLALCDIISSA